MFTFILGAFFGLLVMFAARIADKNVTKVVDRYEKTGKLRSIKPIILEPHETYDEEDRSRLLHKVTGSEYDNSVS